MTQNPKIDDSLLQKLWTKAVGTKGYKKSEWKELEAAFHRLSVYQKEAEERINNLLLKLEECELNRKRRIK